MATSKRATAQRLAALGIAATRPWSEGDAPESGRWVVKPDDGAGSVATTPTMVSVRRTKAGCGAIAHGEPVVLEPWVEGEPISVSLLCGPGGPELLSVNRQHIRVDAAGQVHDDGVEINAIECKGRQDACWRTWPNAWWPACRACAASSASTWSGIPGAARW
ncbi:ATP-grasp domain-containing protein [Cupriavidus basilensis]